MTRSGLLLLIWLQGQAVAVAAASGTERCPVEAREPRVAQGLAALGHALFHEPGLSPSGRLACSGCHQPDHVYGPARDMGPVATGGRNMDRAGIRAVPSLRYAQFAPRFEWHLHVARGDEREDVGPGGGLMADGRAATLDEQALLPLMDASEMANRDAHDLAGRLRRLAAVQRWLRSLAPHVAAAVSRDDTAMTLCAARALAEFQRADSSFHPFDSRYDDFLRGRGELSAQEQRGLALFNDARKGNCAECHPSTTRPGEALPLFTDFRFAALGVPRNPRIPANGDPAFFDQGACGPLRSGAGDESTCGAFRTPSLRNVARRPYFFHNGQFTSLREVVQFYVTRDLDAKRWYGAAGRYDDLPPVHQANVDRKDAPLDRRPGELAALTESEIDDLIAFLNTLDDRS